MGKDDFLQLLVAQLKHQDPLNPMNAEEFAAQLAQFSSLEQLIQVNDNLSAQQEMSSAMMNVINASSALGVIGKDVLAAVSAVDYTGDPDQTVTVGVGGTGGNGILRILDEKGKEVGQRELGYVAGGRQDITLGSAAAGLEPGRYRFEVKITDEDGEPVEVQGFAKVQIDGVRYGPGGPVLISGTLEIPLSSVVEVLTRDQNEPRSSES